MELHVENFGPIRDANVRLRPLTVIFGPNNAGKSYLALLIYALRRPINIELSGSGFELVGFAAGQFVWNTNVQKKSSTDERLAIKQWLQEWSKNPKDFKISDLPAIVQEGISNRLERFMPKMPSGLTREIQRCFASELNELLRTDARGKARLNIKQEDPPIKIEMSISGKKLKLLRYSADLGNFVIHKNELLEFPSSLWQDALGPFIIMRVLEKFSSSSSYYLPAARSGILQGHKLIASVALRRLPLVGIEAISIPKLSGVVADFIGNILSLESKPGSKMVSEIGEFLEEKVCQGKIKRRTGDEKAELPEIYYQLNGTEVPLHRTSSMVSEMAPIILFLKFLVNKGDLLIIEEPEAHLHPDSQRIVARAIVRLIRAGVRVLITTHSDYFVQQISNFVLLSQSAEKRSQLGYEPDEYLNAGEVGAYLFRSESVEQGSTAKELKVTKTSGIPEDEFVAIAHDIYEESAILETPH